MLAKTVMTPTNYLEIILGKRSQRSLKQIRLGRRSRVAATDLKSGASLAGNTRDKDPTTRPTSLNFFFNETPGLQKENTNNQQATETLSSAINFSH